jgi:hypothetical protein
MAAGKRAMVAETGAVDGQLPGVPLGVFASYN